MRDSSSRNRATASVSTKESPHFRDISQLVHFTEEEAVILKSAIENIDDNNVLKQNLKRKLYSVYDNKTLADTVVRGKNAPEHPAADRSHRGAAAGGPARLPVAARRRGPRPPGGTFRFHDQLCAGVVLRPRKPLEQALQNVAHRLRGALQRGVGTRCRTRRRLHRRDSACTAERAAAYVWNWACWPTTCCARNTRWPNAT